ncbi:hypothetical protein [Deinococcus sp. DB0503]|uniref:hypothetical protein n=1 Tax=Deinococcus sp. DB0503 TaxID=2479203 RepID=UPI0018E04D91|nr:hypothetical protein [Deinococcus sp. DB0503]
MPLERCQRRQALGRAFGVAFALNYAWEMLQMPLFLGMDWTPSSWVLCAAAAGGDAAFTTLLYAAFAYRSGEAWWVCRRDAWDVALVVASGCLAAVMGERVAQALGWWSYSPSMPRVPGLGVGAAPLVQVAVLAVITFEALRALGPCHSGRDPLQ